MVIREEDGGGVKALDEEDHDCAHESEHEHDREDHVAVVQCVHGERRAVRQRGERPTGATPTLWMGRRRRQIANEIVHVTGIALT